MKFPIFTTLLLSVFTAIAQKPVVKPTTKPAEFALIKGHIDNNTDDFLTIGWTNYLSFSSVTPSISKDGKFVAKIKIDDNFKNIFLEIGNGIELSVEPKDTITVSWDAKKVESSFVIIASNPNRTPDLEKQFQQRKLYGDENYKMRIAINDQKMSDSARFEKINDLYNREIETLLSGDIYSSTQRMAVNIYFDYTAKLADKQLLPKYELYLKKPLAKSNLIPILGETGLFKPFRTESEEYFKTSSNYRDFIFNYVRFRKPFPRSVTLDDGKEREKKVLPFAPALDEYYAGLSSFNLVEIRDWFATKSIMDDFEYYSFDDATTIYKDFITKVKTPYYADTLKTFYNNIQRLKPGSPAPSFVLKNEKGQTVSLNSFKGKVVYIDFWGVGCPPCIYDITNSVPGLHEKYKDKNVVFVNICVDANEGEWKENLKKLNLSGINLLAEGWTTNPVCKAYNIDGIPHYYLINKEGKISNNNSPGPASGTGVYEKLDKLLQ